LARGIAGLVAALPVEADVSTTPVAALIGVLAMLSDGSAWACYHHHDDSD
jgi:hypothetical protein